MSRWRRSAATEAPLAALGEAPGPVVQEGEAGGAGAGSRWSRPSAAATAVGMATEAAPSGRSLNFQSFVDLAGSRMPVLGLGTRQLKGAECREAVKCALRCGYRLIDTAPGFGNEKVEHEIEISQGIRAAGLKREDVFLVSKLPPSEHGDDLEDTLKSSLERLGTSFIDLYLIQSPKGGSIIWTWDAMLQLRERGLAKAVGLCNFSVAQLEALQRTGRELPQVLQVELHVANQQKELCAFCQQHGIVLMSSSPLARGQLLRTSELQQLAFQRRRSSAELAIRWGLQRGARGLFLGQIFPDTW
ncbi:unnamed protein product [Cladocopium goreaui]|uniref:Aldo-keto reductase Mvan_2161 n=1 Tax=Cladocopium goreaui TaxID=2562237 RepID=A0A9P1FG92_9DINO|nr:unnamed protein product [Cladocopium goreaui]